MNGWIITINSIIGLWNDLKSVGFDYLLTRRLNQDVIDCFFGEVRSSNGNALNPTPLQFVIAFKKLFFMNYTNIGTGNCMQDCDNILLRFDNVVVPAIPFENENYNNTFNDIEFHDFETDYLTKISESNVITYISGYLIKKCLNIHHCDICEMYANAGRSLNEHTIYSHYRAYDKTLENLFGKLYLPSVQFVEFVKKLQDLFFERFYDVVPGTKIIKKFYELFLSIQFVHPCNNFPHDYLLKLYAKVRFFYTLKFINRNFKTQKGHAKYIILNHN